MASEREAVIPRLVLAAALWLSAGMTSWAAGPERLVLYFNEDNERVRRAIVMLQQALARDGVSARHRVRLEHVVVEFADAAGTESRFRESLSRHPAVMIAPNTDTAAIAKRVTLKTPVIFASFEDPIAFGLVQSLANPGGNLTGITTFVPVDEKRLELLRQVAPRARRLGILIDHYWQKEGMASELLIRAKGQHGFDGAVFMADSLEDLKHVLSTPQARSMEAWYVPHTVLPFEHPDEVVRLFDAMHKPVVFTHTHFVERGGLLSYQQVMTNDEILRLWATMIGFVLDGVKPGDIPVERPKSFELALNIKAARRLQIAVPSALLKRADRIIDSPLVAGP
jgi:putative ABC transport system substrate-binding protein